MTARHRTFVFLGEIVEHRFKNDTGLAAHGLNIGGRLLQQRSQPLNFRKRTDKVNADIDRPARQLDELTGLAGLQPTPSVFLPPWPVVGGDDSMLKAGAHVVDHCNDPLDVRFIHTAKYIVENEHRLSRAITRCKRQEYAKSKCVEM